jgi:hypothetical protein
VKVDLFLFSFFLQFLWRDLNRRPLVQMTSVLNHWTLLPPLYAYCLHCHGIWTNNQVIGGMAELVNVSTIYSRDLGSNLSIDKKKYFLILFVKIWIQICRVLIIWVLIVNTYAYWPIMLDSTGHIAKKIKPQYICVDWDHLKIYYKLMHCCIYSTQWPILKINQFHIWKQFGHQKRMVVLLVALLHFNFFCINR